jgi:DNA-binding GntR family transcriptional regulator
MVDFRTKEEQVADFLREGIIAGRFPRGTRLKQTEIASLLKTSITPVREALKLLAAEGYVVGDSYRGATVAPFDVSASAEVVNLRVLLETQLVRAAMERMSSQDLADLQALAAEFDDAVTRRDSSVARGVNYRFHFRLYEIARMPQTQHFVQILWARYPFDLINRLEGRAERAHIEHAELMQRLIANDVAGALLVTRQHIEAGWNELRASLDSTVKEAPRRGPLKLELSEQKV